MALWGFQQFFYSAVPCSFTANAIINMVAFKLIAYVIRSTFSAFAFSIASLVTSSILGELPKFSLVLGPRLMNCSFY